METSFSNFDGRIKNCRFYQAEINKEFSASGNLKEQEIKVQLIH